MQKIADQNNSEYGHFLRSELHKLPYFFHLLFQFYLLVYFIFVFQDL